MREINDLVAKAGKYLAMAETALNGGDYGVGFTISREEAKGTLITARLFVDALKSSLAVL
jgi:uncharacterized protein (UPF0332 family)